MSEESNSKKYLSQDNIKFHEFISGEFDKYKGKMEKLEELDCGALSERKNDKCGKDAIKLFPYQRIVRDYINDNTPYRGLLVYHKLGSGKTFSAVSIAENTRRHIIILAPSKLISSWIEHIVMYACDKYNISMQDWIAARSDQKKMKQLIKRLGTKYTFISSNAPNTADQVVKLSLKDKLIIVDESHNLIRILTSAQSKQREQLFKALMTAPNLKLLFLSATPAVSSPYELAILFTLLKGYMYVPNSREKYTLFPGFDKFNEYFVDRERLKIKNKNIFQERITGLVSYYKGISDPHNLIFPTKVGPTIVNVPMSDWQWRVYSRFRSIELDEERRRAHAKKEFIKPEFAKPGRDVGSSYKIKTRQALNFVLPKVGKDGKDIIYPKRPAGMELAVWNKELPSEWRKIFSRIPRSDLELKNLSNYSPKIHAVITTLAKSKIGIGLVYSEFIDFGVGITAKALKANGYHEYSGTQTPDEWINNNKTAYQNFAVLYGQVQPQQLTNIMMLVNHPKNSDGRFLRVLLVTRVIAEGVNLKNIRQIHILEPYWKSNRIDQIIGRGIRICSHWGLPQSQRQVDVFLYISVAPEGVDLRKVLSEDKTTDQSIYDSAERNQRLIDSFLLAIKEAAIDCQLLKKYNFDENLKKCVECNDTSTTEKIYYPNIERHVKVGQSYCIGREIDDLVGPFEIDGELYVYDPFSLKAYQILNLRSIGKYDPRTKRLIIEKQTSRDDDDELVRLVGVIKKPDYMNVLYHPRSLNAYLITRLKPAGEYSLRHREIEFDDDFEAGKTNIEIAEKKLSKEKTKKK